MSISLPEVAARDGASSRAWSRREQREYTFRYLGEVALLAALYYGSAKLGFTLGFSGPVAAIVWLPVGVGIAYLYLRGLVFWPGILLGDLLANDYMRLPLGSALGQTIGNVLEVVVAAYLLRRAARAGNPLARLDGLPRLLLPIAAATMVSATVGTLSSLLGGVVTAAAFPTVWRTWWLGDACGALVVVPLAVAWSQPRTKLSQRQLAEGLLMLATAGGLAALASSTPKPFVYLVFPGLIWAGLRLGQRGATLAVLVVTGVTIWNTRDSAGPFQFESISHEILATQLFIAIATVTTLCVAAVVSERELIAGSLEESRTETLRAADSERRRLERDLHDGAQQRLVALLIRLRIAEEQLEDMPEATAQALVSAEAELQVALDELRELSQGTHPAVLVDLGLVTAIRSVAARTSQRIHLVELPNAPVGEAAERTAYFVFLETVTNAQKHAPNADIEVRVHTTEHAITIEVSDNGPGGASEASGRGLAGLRERVEEAGGSFGVRSIKGVGTTVTAELPGVARLDGA